MPKVIENLLTSVGITPEDVKKIVELPEAEQETFDIKPLTEKVKANYDTQLRNDPDFFKDLTIDKLPPDVKKKIESASFGRAANIVKDKLLKGLGMTEADFEDLSPDQKEKIETLIPIIAERYTKTKTGDKKLQDDVINLRKQLEGFDGIEEKLKTKYETESNEKISSVIFNANLIGALSEIQGLKIPASDIAATANQILQSKYGFARIGDYGIELRQKENKDLKVLKPNSSHELTLKEALTEIATERGWVDKEKEGTTGTGVVKVEPGKNGLQMTGVAAHLQEKFAKKIAAEKDK